MAKRILVPVDRTHEMEFVLSLVRVIARESGGSVRLLSVIPVPTPMRDRLDRVIVSTERQIERLERRATDELRRMAVISLDGVPVETSVIFGDRAVEIGREAECFGADARGSGGLSRRAAAAARGRCHASAGATGRADDVTRRSSPAASARVLGRPRSSTSSATGRIP